MRRNTRTKLFDFGGEPERITYKKFIADERDSLEILKDNFEESYQLFAKDTLRTMGFEEKDIPSKLEEINKGRRPKPNTVDNIDTDQYETLRKETAEYECAILVLLAPISDYLIQLEDVEVKMALAQEDPVKGKQVRRSRLSTEKMGDDHTLNVSPGVVEDLHKLMFETCRPSCETTVVGEYFGSLHIQKPAYQKEEGKFTEETVDDQELKASPEALENLPKKTLEGIQKLAHQHEESLLPFTKHISEANEDGSKYQLDNTNHLLPRLIKQMLDAEIPNENPKISYSKNGVPVDAATVDYIMTQEFLDATRRLGLPQGTLKCTIKKHIGTKIKKQRHSFKDVNYQTTIEQDEQRRVEEAADILRVFPGYAYPEGKNSCEPEVVHVHSLEDIQKTIEEFAPDAQRSNRCYIIFNGHGSNDGAILERGTIKQEDFLREVFRLEEIQEGNKSRGQPGRPHLPLSIEFVAAQCFSYHLKELVVEMPLEEGTNEPLDLIEMKYNLQDLGIIHSDDRPQLPLCIEYTGIQKRYTYHLKELNVMKTDTENPGVFIQALYKKKETHEKNEPPASHIHAHLPVSVDSMGKECYIYDTQNGDLNELLTEGKWEPETIYHALYKLTATTDCLHLPLVIDFVVTQRYACHIKDGITELTVLCNPDVPKTYRDWIDKAEVQILEVPFKNGKYNFDKVHSRHLDLYEKWAKPKSVPQPSWFQLDYVDDAGTTSSLVT